MPLFADFFDFQGFMGFLLFIWLGMYGIKKLLGSNPLIRSAAQKGAAGILTRLLSGFFR